ncbi:ribonuclease HIII [Cytobacillus sp. S13-E01]|uniref:ribonuclease HIII n=1 Tax=Cytobacillus sp. S13-E01 TaxID=3031326 RepID=UPI0023D894A1|nr:ribonuclease HIII [Cytobacillus sp. S13-E01]MDF0729044.1 ribonuclease HIII [Cytobacillus sp. S13-E01]
MSNAVIKVQSSVIEKMKQHYSSSLTNKIPPGGLFVAKLSNCTVTAYKSGKVLFQGSDSILESSKWSTQTKGDKVTKSSAKPKPQTIYSPPDNIATLSIIGSDEVGTGDYFGPMTVVAAYVSKQNLSLLRELGVKDSKNLTDTQIAVIAKQVIKAIPYSLLILHNEKYNDLQESGMSQGKIKALLHNQALINVLEKIKPEKPDGILIDQFAEPGVYYRYLAGQSVPNENVYFSTKAEGVHLAVAAASIVARYAFVKEFEKLSVRAGIDIPKGAGSKVDLAAATLIKKHGVAALRSFTKLHFANTDKAKALVKK